MTTHDCEIIDVNYTNQKRDGSPLVSKFGKPMWNTNVKISARPDVWINGLAFREPSDWVGKTLALELYTEEYKGKAYPKFKLPPRPGGGGGLNDQKLDRIIELLTMILGAVRGDGEAQE
jgi:hypothetical protein